MLQLSPGAEAAYKDKTVLLTGASGGLGAQLALQLAESQVKTIILSARSETSLQTVADQCQDLLPSSSNIHMVTCDLSDKSSVKKLGEQALSLTADDGGIDVLINCGGVSSRSNFVDTQLDIDEKVMQINFLSGAALCKAVVPGMTAKGNGKIIWISSVQGLVGIPSRTSYAASKFAVQGYCEALRPELAPSGITVHCVSPGYIRTNLSRSALTGDGTAHGKMDATTAKGADPADLAVEILEKVAKGRKDFVVAAPTSAKVAIWAKLLCPGVLQRMLVKRFEKSQKQEEDTKSKDD